jgi:light-regulated signal transduction histidine kinase (bacteriophytochrome)
MLGLKTSRAISGTARAVVQRPVASVFDFVGHGFFENYTRWSPQVVELEALSGRAARPGAKARQVTLDRGVRIESTFEIAEFAPPHILRLRGLSDPYRSLYQFERQTPDSTQVSFSFELEERRLFMQPFRDLVRESLEEGARLTVEKLKQALESDHAAATSPEPLARFVYVASLDLREPLRKIEAFSDLLDNAMASSNKADMIYAKEAMHSCAVSARKLVDDLLTYSSTILGDQSLKMLDLREEIELALARLKEPIRETKSEIDVEIPAARFLADPSQFSCLLDNTLTNAIKYRKPGEGAKVKISAAAVDEKTLRLAIQDQGVGFREEFAQAIFEPFRKISGATEYPGTGIELAICKSIADRHGWDIAVKAQPGEGAAFYFTIPMLADDGGRDCAPASLAGDPGAKSS